MLQDENNDLKKMIEELQKKLLGNNGQIGDEDKAAFPELKEQYDFNMKVLEDMEKIFNERPDVPKSKLKELIKEKVDLSLTHLVILTEDPQLSHKLKFALSNLSIHFEKHVNPPPRIIPSGIGINQSQTVFVQDNEDKVFDPEANGYRYIKGKKMYSKRGQILNNKDLIVISNNMIMLHMKKSNSKEIFDRDWKTLQLELQRERENSAKRQELANKQRKQEEFDLLKKDLEEKYEKEKEETELNLKKNIKDYGLKIEEMIQNAKKTHIEAEKKTFKMLNKQNIDFFEGEKAKKKRELEMRGKTEK